MTAVTITAPRSGAVYPANIVPPTFRWSTDKAYTSWRVSLRLPGRTAPISVVTGQTHWRPTAVEWDLVRQHAVQRDATLVVAPADGAAGAEAAVSFRVSADPLTAPIFFREVMLPAQKAMENLTETKWKLGNIASTEPPRVLLQGMKICANCHAATADGRTIGMDVDTNNDKGAYIVSTIERELVFSQDKVISWNSFEPSPDGRQSFGLLSSISPDGRYIISTVRDMPVYKLLPDPGYSQLFFPGRGILVVYDRQTKRFAPLPGADDPAYVQTSAVWSPDGVTIVFARARALGTDFSTNDFAARKATYRYDLYRIPFNGGRGGIAEPLAGASGNGRSNYFPKFTPDGKWIVYTQSDSFMIIQPDAELHIVPAGGGTNRRMACNTPGRMASWHSIDPSGRWMVFSSKADGPYTRLWLTHLDENGNDSPPVQLEGFGEADRAANIPEFLNIAPDGLIKITNKL